MSNYFKAKPVMAVESRFITSRDGRRIHYSTDGTGPVTVFFEAGLGKARTTWAGVQPAVSGFAGTVVYDRAGLGRSDPTCGPRTCEDMVADHNLVRAAAIHGPCVVVGHSYGGLIARCGAVREPADVAGVVLVDEVSELCDEIVFGHTMRGSGVYYRLRRALARYGLLGEFAPRLLKRLIRSDVQNIDIDAVSEAIHAIEEEDCTFAAADAALREWHGFIPSVRRVRASGPWVPDVPLTEISANRVPESERDRDYIGTSHHAIAELATDGRHVFSHSSSHHLQLVEPEIVVTEIHAQVQAIVDARAV